ncbi:MAG: oligosaccharide flippase family protein [Gracilimonas sp.]|nr:oligosaccharide flippase family protein [Gracilimonas sp.]
MSNFREELQKGAFVNFMGILGKMAGPGLLIMINQLYGTAIYGIYITGNLIIELSLAFLTSGFKSGSLIFVSKYVDDEDEHHKMYLSLANAFTWGLILGILVIVVIFFFSEPIFNSIYGTSYSERLIPLLYVMVFAIPMMAFEQVVISGSQGLKIMKYEAIINGGLRPVLFLLLATGFYFINSSAVGIGYGYMMAQLVVFGYSLYVFNKLFSWSGLWNAFKKFEVNTELIKFALPQNVNITLNKFITGIDILMLPALGASELLVGIYGTGSMIIREVRHIKLAFSGAFNPHIIRFYKDKDFKGLSEGFSLTANWIASLAIPVLLLLAVLNEDLLNWISSEPVSEAAFMLFLLPVPYIYCSFSLAGNIVTMTGHSMYALMNSILIATINVALNFLLIPKYGLAGAAMASSLATFSITILENIEARYLANAKLHFKTVYKPHLAGIISAMLVFLVFWFNLYGSDISERTIFAVAIVVTFAAIYIGLDYKLVRKRIRRYLNKK